MLYLALAFIFFLLFFVTHVVGYRLKLVRFEPLRFLFISAVWLGLYLFLLKLLGISLWTGGGPEDFVFTPFVWSSIFLYLLLCLAYVAESTAIENESPSMRIIKSILQSPEGRLSFEELKIKFSDREFIHDRLNDLVEHGHVSDVGGLFRLSARGALIASIIKNYRRLIGRGLGG